MSITSFIERSCVQDAVYWGNPVANGYGGYTFNAPVEIKCRWEDKKQVVADNDGKELVIRSQVYVLQDLNEEGYLFLGELNDLSSDPSNPRTEDSTYQIKRFHKVPALGRTDEFLRIAYLSERVGG